MKTRVIAVAVTLLALGASAGEGIIRRGSTIAPEAKAIVVDKLLETPGRFEKTPVVVEGVVVQACSRKGCWMELAPAAGKRGLRITFKDYGFFVPLDSKGSAARAEGVTKVRTLSRKEADHLEEEGAQLHRNADGTAREVSFVASGVELRKSSS